MEPTKIDLKSQYYWVLSQCYMKKSTKLPLTGLPAPEMTKTSISGPTVLLEYAEHEIAAGGWNSLSAYLWDFVRRRRELDIYNVRRSEKPSYSESSHVEKILELGGEAVTQSGATDKPKTRKVRPPRGASR